MDYFNYRNGELYAEDVAVADIAERFGTPAYIYSRATLERAFEMARSGRFHSVTDLRDALNREGYAGSQIVGRVLARQLSEIMKTAKGRSA